MALQVLGRRSLVALAVPAIAAAAEPLAALEQRHGGRLGVAILDTGSGRRILHRASERLALCSTFKALAAGAVLARVEAGQDSLDRVLRVSPDQVVPYSPLSGPRAGLASPWGMTLAEACEATVTLSDNTAGNLVLQTLGGPAGLTAWLRSIGDDTTRLDRWEPELNDVVAGDPRDTTTPEALAATLGRIALGPVLSLAGRALLQAWLTGCRTGDRRIRAGIPAGWRVGDKTGTGPAGETNDVAVLWPAGRAPILVAALYAGSPAPAAERDAVLAEVGRIAAAV